VDEASAAKLEELRLGAVSQGKEWLSRSLSEIPKKRASSPGWCGWCGDTFQPELVACSRAAQLLDESLGTLHGGWVQPKMCFDRSCFCERIWMFVTWCNVVG